MTAYLKRGDLIHVAVPATNEREALAAQQTLTRMYAEQGVTVLAFQGSSLLAHPVVVAVFRDEPEASA